MNNRTFTLSEANALLPQLKEDLAKLQELVKQFEDRYLELQEKKAEIERTAVDRNGGRDPFFEREGELDFLRLEADLLIGNFARKGAMLKMINPGLIDFPAVLNGEDVLMCWKEGEESITHYHDWHDGFKGRKLILDA